MDLIYTEKIKTKGEEPSIDWDKKPTDKEKMNILKQGQSLKQIQVITLEIMFGGGDH